MSEPPQPLPPLKMLATHIPPHFAVRCKSSVPGQLVLFFWAGNHEISCMMNMRSTSKSVVEVEWKLEYADHDNTFTDWRQDIKQ